MPSTPSTERTASVFFKLWNAAAELTVLLLLLALVLYAVGVVVGRLQRIDVDGIVTTTSGFVVLLPTVLMACLTFVVGKALSPRAELELKNTDGPPSLRAEHGFADAFTDAAACWEYERQQAQMLRWRFGIQGVFFGFFASTGLALCVLIAGATLISPREALIDLPTWNAAAIAVSAAILVSFVRDYARLLVRAANRDSSTQMFAWCTKRLFVVVGTTILLACLQGIDGLKAELFKRALGYVLMGAGAAFIGDRATLAVTDRVAKLLGASVVRREGAVDVAAAIDGIGEDDAMRLAEEGIDSVHALAFFSTPKLFFGTPFSLARLCDWQDQALLMARIGDANARLFRDQLYVRGAIDARALAVDFVSGKLDATRREDLCKVLGLTYFQAESAMKRLANDELARRLRIYRELVPFAATGMQASGLRLPAPSAGTPSVPPPNQAPRSSSRPSKNATTEEVVHADPP